MQQITRPTDVISSALTLPLTYPFPAILFTHLHQQGGLYRFGNLTYTDIAKHPALFTTLLDPYLSS
jgi:hypothetical protein